MSNDLLNLLSGDEVPESPRGLSKRVHDRLNPRLLGFHLAEFARTSPPVCVFPFPKSYGPGALVFTLTGRLPKRKEKTIARMKRTP